MSSMSNDTAGAAGSTRGSTTSGLRVTPDGNLSKIRERHAGGHQAVDIGDFGSARRIAERRVVMGEPADDRQADEGRHALPGTAQPHAGTETDIETEGVGIGGKPVAGQVQQREQGLAVYVESPGPAGEA